MSLRTSLLTACLVVLLTATGCAVNPVTGDRELLLIPTSMEISAGEEYYRPLQQVGGGLYTVDRELTEYVKIAGQRMAAVSDRSLPYEFVVLNNSVPNAWALPGGKIAISRGLLAELDNEAELAAVLGHEIVHAAAKHSAHAMQRSILGQLLMVGTAVALGDSGYVNYILGASDIGCTLSSRATAAMPNAKQTTTA